MTTDTSPSNKIFLRIHKGASHVKGYFLDAAGIAGVFLALLFAFKGDPLAFMTNYFLILYVCAIIIAFGALFIKRKVFKQSRSWNVFDFVSLVAATSFMWFIVVDNIKGSSDEAMEIENLNTRIDVRFTKLQASQTLRSQELESMKDQLVDLKKKIEELESNEITDKVEP